MKINFNLSGERYIVLPKMGIFNFPRTVVVLETDFEFVFSRWSQRGHRKKAE